MTSSVKSTMSARRTDYSLFGHTLLSIYTLSLVSLLYFLKIISHDSGGRIDPVTISMPTEKSVIAFWKFGE